MGWYDRVGNEYRVVRDPNLMKKVFPLVMIFLFIVGVVFSIHKNKEISEQEEIPKSGFGQVINSSGIGTEGTSEGVSWADYNGDGYQDLLMLKPKGKLQLYRNNHNETFTEVAHEAGLDDILFAHVGIFADFDNDGCPDLYVSNRTIALSSSGISDSLYHNNCNGTFTDVSAKAITTDTYRGERQGVAVGDYDNDGFLDIYVVSYGVVSFIKTDSQWTVEDWLFEPNILYHNNGDGTFTNVTDKAHVAGVTSCKNTNYELLNRPKGGDENSPILKGNWQPVWFDYDNDGLLDLYVTNENMTGILYHNNGDGTFTDTSENIGLCKPPRPYSTHGTAVGDFDNDGYLDLYLAGSQQNIFWHNNGNGTFKEISEETNTVQRGFLGWGVGAFDFENDGYLDIYSINGATSNASFKYAYLNRSDRLYRNNGAGQFSEVAEEMGVSGNDLKYAGAFADFNNDGFVDAFIVSQDVNQPPVLNRLYKNIPNGNRWLTVKLIGTKSNRDGVGAMITAEVEGKKQIRQVISGSSLISQNSIWQTFGFGSFLTVDTLTVHWPSGIVQKFYNVKTDQVLTITEEE